MAEYINKADLLKELDEDGAYGYLDIYQIESLPTVDITFCKNCKHRRGGNCFKEYPLGFNHKKDTEFCSKGERRK